MALRRATVYVKKLREDAALPRYETQYAAGVDLRAYLPEGGAVIIPVGGRHLFKTGMAVEIPPNFELTIRPRSGLALNHGIYAHIGTIDADYRGEIGVVLFNLGDKGFCVNHGDRIAQAVLNGITQAIFREAKELSGTERGEDGFGSTGIK